MSDFGEVHRYNVTGLFHDMWGFPSDRPGVVRGLIRHLVDKINKNAHQIARYKEYHMEDARTVLISYGASARSALHVVQSGRRKGERLGLLELQTLWPFPMGLVREKCADARQVVVVEMNMGQITQAVKLAVDRPERVFLANRIDGILINPTDIRNILRLIRGEGVYRHGNKRLYKRKVFPPYLVSRLRPRNRLKQPVEGHRATWMQKE
jgi:2-oxoglutarate ferredoxin oxidoreductase subunit alpha